MKQNFDVVGEFKEGLARIKKFGAYGFINEAGEQVIGCNFSDASDFCEGLARVKKFGKFGFINKNGEQVTRCKFDDASDFCNGLAKVKLNGKWFEIDSSGKDPNAKENDEKVEILKDISSFQSDIVELKKDEEFKPINIKDEDIRKIEIPIEFDDTKRIDRSSVVKNIVQEDGKWYEVDADGKMRPLDENSNEMDFLTKFTESDEFKKILSDSTKVFEWSNVSVNGKDIVLDKDGKKIDLSKEGKFIINNDEHKVEISNDAKTITIGEGSNKIEIPMDFNEAKSFKKVSTVTKNMVKKDGKWYEIDGNEEPPASENSGKVEALKDGNFIVQDSGGEKVKILKNGSATIINTGYKNKNLSQSNSNIKLKKGSIKYKNVGDWFDEKENEYKNEKRSNEDSSGSEIVWSIVLFILMALLGLFGQR